MQHRFVAPTSRGTEALLAAELQALGAQEVVEARGAVRFRGPLAVAYRALLWSRGASRVLLVLRVFPASDARDLYEGVADVDWLEHLDPAATLAVDCVGEAPWLRNTHYAELTVKDAVVDQLRARTGARPSVDTVRPDIRLHLYLTPGEAVLSLDLAGDPLHRRGLHRGTGEAPLKENLAAALLLTAGWPEAAAAGAPLVDPMCGAGTLLVEAAWMARDTAPGLLRERWGFTAWRPHEPGTWRALLDEAQARRDQATRRPLQICGADDDPRVLEITAENLRRAGIRQGVALERRAVADAAPPGDRPGLLITNPPYGQRLGEEAALREISAALGDALRQRFLGWDAWVFTASKALAGAIGLRPRRRVPLWNGPLECRLLHLPIDAAPAQGRPGWRPAG